MLRSNQPHYVKARRERALQRLLKSVQSERVKTEIDNLQKKIKV